MEYKIFRYLRHHIQIPFFIRFIFACFFILLAFMFIFLPIFPGSLFIGVIILVTGIILIVKGEKIKHVIKIRKGIIYLTKNLHSREIISHKINDIKIHINKILHNNKKNNQK